MRDVTIVIPTYNGEEFMDELLTAIRGQKSRYSYETLVIDSGSSDATIDIVGKFPEVRLHRIPNTEFGHGKTRNLGAQMADSTFVVYLTQDAVPSHDQWLEYMIEPFSISDKVGCVFGRQIPRPHCFLTLKREVAQVFKSFGDDGSIALQRKSDLTAALGITNNFLSDVNSAVRKSIWQEIPFQDVNYSEDQALGIDMLNAGYYKAYSPLGSVMHSHDYPLQKYFKRKFDEYVGLRKSTGYVAQASVRELVVGSTKATLQDYMYLLRDREFTPGEKVHDFFLAPFYNIATRRAIRKAARSLTDEDIRKHSLEAAARAKTGG